MLLLPGAAVVFSGLCSRACLLGLWASGHPSAVPGQFHVRLTPLSGQSLSLGPESDDVRRRLLSGQSAAVLQPVGKRIGPDGRSESEGRRGAGWALLAEDSQARWAAIGCGVWSMRRSERPSVRRAMEARRRAGAWEPSRGLSRSLGRQVFSSPVNGAARNAGIQACGVVGTWAGGVWTPCSCPRLWGHLSEDPCCNPAGPGPIQESSSRAVTRMATTGRCSVTRAVATAGVWTSWAWS